MRRALGSAGWVGGLQVGIAGAVVLALLAPALVGDAPGPDVEGVETVEGVEAAALPAVTTTTAVRPPSSTTTATTLAVPDEMPPSVPIEDGGAESALYGWGTAQPTQMRASVHFGGTDTVLSGERRQLLGLQLMQVRQAALAVGTVAEAERQGFVRNFQRIDGRGFEYINWQRFFEPLDLSKPTMLAFEDDAPDSRVVSVAFNIVGSAEDGPPTDLPLEVIPWHYHSDLCEADGTIVGSVDYEADGTPYADQVQRCLDLGARFRPELNHWMVDLWVVPGWENPWGLVSSKHPDLMFEPTPWFSGGGGGRGEADGFGVYCELPEDDLPARPSSS